MSAPRHPTSAEKHTECATVASGLNTALLTVVCIPVHRIIVNVKLLHKDLILLSYLIFSHTKENLQRNRQTMDTISVYAALLKIDILLVRPLMAK